MQAFGEYSEDGTASAMKARDYKDATDLVAIPIHDQATRNAGKRGDKQDGKGNGLGVGKPGDPCPTLTKGDKHAVLYENHPNDSRVTGPHEVAPSCVSRFGTGGGNVPLVQESVPFRDPSPTLTNKMQGQAGWAPYNEDAHLVGVVPLVQAVDVYNQKIDGDTAATLTKACGGTNTSGAKVMAVDCYNKTINEKSQAISSSASDINHTGGVINPMDRMAVRRLTPKECERLQGFGDNHTLIPWRGKPADQCPDGPRYKALGNSMAVPCMAWIGKRIDKVDRENRKATK